MSAITPPPSAKQALPLNPAKKRNIIRVAMVFEKPQPRVNATKNTLVKLKIVARPNISESGAQSNGPAAKPCHKLLPQKAHQNVNGYSERS
jgi:hypothetical protein